jgi:Zn ribbon nucleic-acid-binding protein
MSNTISRAPYPGLGHCTVCGQWKKLEMWDDGLNGRFCVDCYDRVVDAEEFLSNGLRLPESGRQASQTK